MKEKIPVFLIAFLLTIFFANTAKAQLQNVAATGGGYFEGTQLSLSYTIGEAAIQTLESGNFMLTQGFQQPKLLITVVDELKNLSIKIQAYPNPVTDLLKLVTSEQLPEGSTYQLFSINGSRIAENKLDGTITEIEFQSLISSTYFLKVMQNAQTLKTFKIIKK